MDLEEILRLDMCPFDYGAMEGHFRNDTDGALLEKEAQFSLFLRYMDSFMDRYGLPFRFRKGTAIWRSIAEARCIVPIR